MQFKDIIGQEITANKLTKIIDSGRVSHAQLFLGDTASGSLALAISYVQYLCCTNRQHYGESEETATLSAASSHVRRALRADSCGECPTCKKISQLIYTDLNIIFPNASTPKVQKPTSKQFNAEIRDFLLKNSQRGRLEQWYEFIGAENKQGVIRAEDADEMIKTLSMKSYEGGYKIMILWMVEKMNASMSNKILKILEEPYPNTLIIMVAEDDKSLLSTIRSRVQTVRIPSYIVPEQNPDFASRYVVWMRQLFKLNMLSLSEWVDTMHSMTREQQKQYLTYAQEATRECFLRNMAGLPLQLDFGDEKFNTMFPTMMTTNNIEAINNAFNEAITAIERNAYSKFVFMELSFRMSKALKKR